jgi:hypothetical protein
MATSFSGGGSQSTRTTTDHREASGKLYHWGICYVFFQKKYSDFGGGKKK